ncbi:phage holin family protein [Castellaniella sp.]|uniref:phage holin family protein n=1 Tax=Castellaniella sp. TaxID=1955812 RepID=UPI003A911BFB
MATLGQVAADLAAQLAALLGTRLELLGLEAQDVRDRLLCRLAQLVLAVFLLALAVLVATLTIALYFWPTQHRYLALCLLALGYAALGAVVLVCLLRRLKTDPPPFAVSAQVLQQDVQAFKIPAAGSATSDFNRAPDGTDMPDEDPFRGMS